MTRIKIGVESLDVYSELVGTTKPKETEHTCPMASMCKGMMENKAGVGLLAFVPGTLLLLVGALVLIKPGILVWLVGGTSIVLGAFALVIAIHLRRWAAAAAKKS